MDCKHKEIEIEDYNNDDTIVIICPDCKDGIFLEEILERDLEVLE